MMIDESLLLKDEKKKEKRKNVAFRFLSMKSAACSETSFNIVFKP
jgi:hypothetical protein